MKKFLAILLVALMCLSALAACHKPENTTAPSGQSTSDTSATTSANQSSSSDDTTSDQTLTTDSTPNNTSDTTTPQEDPLLFNSIKINGVPLSDYEIVYSNGDALYSDKNTEDLGNIAGDFYKQSAEKLNTMLSGWINGGVNLSVSRYPSPAARQIFVGPSTAPAAPSPTAGVAEDIDNYTIIFDYNVENVCAGFQFGGASDGFVMWQIQGNGTLTPHVWTTQGLSGNRPQTNIFTSSGVSATSPSGWFTMKIEVRKVGDDYLVNTYVGHQGGELKIAQENFNLSALSNKKSWPLAKIGIRQDGTAPEIANYDNIKVYDNTNGENRLIYNETFEIIPEFFANGEGLGGNSPIFTLKNGYLHVAGASWFNSSVNVVDWAAYLESDEYKAWKAQYDAWVAGGSKTMELDDYKIYVENGNLIVEGGTYGTTWHAIDYLEQYLRAQKNAGKNDLDLTGEMASGTHHLITVGCVGDSITDGHGSDPFYPGGAVAGRNIMSYPAILQRLLWKDYVVYNFGKQGTTMRDDATLPYKNSSEYEAFVEHMATLDVITILLGTNDAVQIGDWGTASQTKFYNDYAAFLDMIETANGDKTAHIIAMNCMPCYINGSNHARPEVQNMIKKVANDYSTKSGYDVSFFDMNTFAKNNLGSGDFPDGLHPNNNGYVKVANKLKELVTAYYAAAN